MQGDGVMDIQGVFHMINLYDMPAQGTIMVETLIDCRDRVDWFDSDRKILGSSSERMVATLDEATNTDVCLQGGAIMKGGTKRTTPRQNSG